LQGKIFSQKDSPNLILAWKTNPERLKKETAHQMQRYQTDLKCMDIYKLTEKEPKIISPRKLSKVKENRQITQEKTCTKWEV
jgi:hypothetical protein